MEGFDLFIPSGGVRQPRIQYAVDDPSMAILEELRAFGGYRNLNTVYTEALKLGAEILLQRAVEEGRWVRQSGRSAEPTSTVGKRVSALSPVKVKDRESRGRRRSPAADAAVRREPRDALPVSENLRDQLQSGDAVAGPMPAKAVDSSGQPPWRSSSLSDADNLERASVAMRTQSGTVVREGLSQTVIHSGANPADHPSAFTGESRGGDAAADPAPLTYRPNPAADAAFDQYGD